MNRMRNEQFNAVWLSVKVQPHCNELSHVLFRQETHTRRRIFSRYIHNNSNASVHMPDRVSRIKWFSRWVLDITCSCSVLRLLNFYLERCPYLCDLDIQHKNAAIILTEAIAYRPKTSTLVAKSSNHSRKERRVEYILCFHLSSSCII